VSYVEILHPDLDDRTGDPRPLQRRKDSELAAGFALFVAGFCLNVIGTFVSVYAAWRESRMNDIKWCKSAAHWLNVVLTSSFATVLISVAVASSSWQQLDVGTVVDIGLFKFCLVGVRCFCLM